MIIYNFKTENKNHKVGHDEMICKLQWFDLYVLGSF